MLCSISCIEPLLENESNENKKKNYLVNFLEEKYFPSDSPCEHDFSISEFWIRVFEIFLHEQETVETYSEHENLEPRPILQR